MSDQCLVVPVQHGNYQCNVTPPWFVNGSEYRPNSGTFQLLINGEEAFGAVHHAIASAERSVCIICWGFQPSMYFVRDGSAPSIGELLEQQARDGVIIRVLSWELRMQVTPDFGLGLSPINVTGIPFALDESNTPGRWDQRLYDRPPTSTDAQYAYDKEWYYKYDDRPGIYTRVNRIFTRDPKAKNLHFRGRGFDSSDRAKLATQHYEDKGLDYKTKGFLSAFPSHHQKMVLVDYEDPKRAIGFVMGHNMLDAYWDTSEHSSRPRTFLRAKHPEPNPNLNPNGKYPRHDFSTRLTGPIIGDVFANFAQAWKDETGETLPPGAFKDYPLRSDDKSGTIMGQILRTQPQHGRQDIKECYLQAVNNATQYIHVENQYFRWPPLAEKIKAAAAGHGAGGRNPETHGSLYLFVITNSSNEGVGPGTVTTYRMLDSLGRADAIPGVARLERADDIDAQIGKTDKEIKTLQSEKTALDQQARQLQGVPGASSAVTRTYETVNAKLEGAKARKKALEQQKQTMQDGSAVIAPEERPGLKFHVCTLVSPDTADGEDWIEVYIHAKLMLIDDAFMTVGSANINTRSMQVDSELNIAHHRPEITRPARQTLWGHHTKNRSGQEAMGKEGMKAAHNAWADIMKKNADRKSEKQRPIAPLAAFLRTDPTRKALD